MLIIATLAAAFFVFTFAGLTQHFNEVTFKCVSVFLPFGVDAEATLLTTLISDTECELKLSTRGGS